MIHRRNSVIFVNLLVLALRRNVVFGQTDEPEKCESIASRCLLEILPAEDILPIICHHLSMQDLHRSRSVCTLFKDAADRILRKRGPELKGLQVKQFFENQPIPEHLSRSLRIRPQIALFFTGNKSPANIYWFTSTEIFSRFGPELPPDVSLIHASGLTTILDDQPVAITKNKALGLFLPKSQPNIIEVQVFADTNNRVLRKMFDISLEQNHIGMIFLNSPLLLYENNRNSFIYKSLSIIEQEIIQINDNLGGSFALWGGRAEWLTMPNMGNLPIFYTAIRISGPMVQCWSIAINLMESSSQITQHITNFRDKIRINDNSIGMVLVAVNDDNPNTEANLRIKPLRVAFPGLTTMSYGIRKNSPMYCYNSFEPRPKNSHDLTIKYDSQFGCFMVVTYF